MLPCPCRIVKIVNNIIFIFAVYVLNQLRIEKKKTHKLNLDNKNVALHDPKEDNQLGCKDG